MHPSLQLLFNDLRGDDAAHRDRAMTQIAMLLELNSWPRGGDALYQAILGTLVGIQLDAADHAEIAERLVHLSAEQPANASIPAAIGCALPNAALAALLQAMRTYWEKYSDETRWQCLVALRDLLIYRQGEIPAPELLSLLRTNNPESLIALSVQSADARLAKCASEVSNSLRRYLGRARGT